MAQISTTEDQKYDYEEAERAVIPEKSEQFKHGDRALALVGDETIELTEEENKRILRKTDRYILSVLIWVYLLQIFDKTIFGQGKILGMTQACHLKGNQYSLASTMNSFAQLAWQPFSSYILVRVPARYLLTFLMFGWGASQCCVAASTSFAGLSASRFFLGLFEAGCLPLLGLITAQFYRRSEQPVRIAAWNGVTNGLATILSAIVAFGFSHVKHSAIAPWQLLYVTSGLLTLVSVPVIYMIIDSDVVSARFLTEEERPKAIERLRANQTGTGTNEFKWDQVVELLLDIKTYLFLALCIMVNTGQGVTIYFGPTLINNFGFDVQISTLLNMPFGVLQILVLFGSWVAQKIKIKSVVCVGLICPVLVGIGLLYKQGVQGYFYQPEALAGYYLIAFVFGNTPIVIAWMASNTAGQTKKSLILSVFMFGAAIGNIVGPLLFNANDGPFYLHGIRSCIGIFAAFLAGLGIMVATLYLFNKQRERQRVANGKPAKIKDTSMDAEYERYGREDVTLGHNALLDMTDIRNDEFTYVY